MLLRNVELASVLGEAGASTESVTQDMVTGKQPCRERERQVRGPHTAKRSVGLRKGQEARVAGTR